MHRDEELVYAGEHDIPVPASFDSAYSVDENLWGRSVESGLLEDPWLKPPEDAYTWTTSPREAPDQPETVEIEFDQGIPVALNGESLEGVELIARLNRIGGRHGVGRIDHIENRLVGIKSREVYEAPAAVVLHAAHQELEYMTLSKDQIRFKDKVAAELSDLIYNGLWFSALHQDLAAFISSTQRYASGVIQVEMYKGNVTVVGRRAQYALYDPKLATYSKDDTFDHAAAAGFIAVFGLQLRTQAQYQWLGRSADDILRLSAGDRVSDVHDAGGGHHPSSDPNMNA